MPPVGEVPLLACSKGQTPGQLGTEVVGVDDRVHDQVRGQADQVDVSRYSRWSPLDLGRPLRLGEGGQLVVVDGVDDASGPITAIDAVGRARVASGSNPGPAMAYSPARTPCARPRRSWARSPR